MARARKEVRGFHQVKLPFAQWSVMWVSKGQIFERKVQHDLAEAVRLHALLTKAGRKGVTLRCCNSGHPPPDHALNHEVEEVVRVQRGGKTYKVRRTRYENRMRDLNKRGVWWCPYCMKFRRFSPTVWEDQHLMQCPMCDITTRDWHVKRWNPMAVEIMYRRRRRRSSGQGKSTRSRRRT